MKTTACAAIAALLSFLIGIVWIFVSPRIFVQFFYSASMVALTHTFTLGWVSLMIIGVLRQLAPIAFGLKLRRPNLIGSAVGLWIPAVIAMIAGFQTSRFTLAAVGTSLLLVSVLTVVGVFLAAFAGVRREPPHDHLMASLLYFAAAAVIGAWMGLAKGFDVPLAGAFHRVLFAHIHLAGAGWAGMMILAVMSRLFPQPHLRHPVQAKVRFIVFNVGLVGLTLGLLLDRSWYPTFGAVLAIACIWYALAFIPVLRQFQQPSDHSTQFLVASWICLAAVGVTGLWLCTGIGETGSFRMQLQFVYGFVYMFGWLSLMILGMLYRILPTHISKLLAARGINSAPGMRRALIQPRSQNVTLLLLAVGLSISAFAIVSQNVALFRLGWLAWMLGIACFVYGLVRVGIFLAATMRSHST